MGLFEDMEIQRQLVLITNPGIPGDEHYAKQAQDVIDRWEAFFTSPIGGFWQEREIIRINEQRPIGPGRMDTLMSQLDLERCEYSVIVFCGHGLRTQDHKDGIQLPIPSQGNLNVFPVERLMGISHATTQIPTHIRRTIILDACRKIQPITAEALFEQREFSGGMELDGEMCRDHYNEIIMRQEPHVELLQSTGAGDYAYTSDEGSIYGDAVMRYIRSQTVIWGAQALTDKEGKFDVKMKQMQSEVSALIEGQRPQYWSSKPETEGYPFAAYHVYVPRTFEQVVADIEIMDD